MLLSAVLPICLLVLLGFLIRRSAWLSPGFWADTEKLTYFLLLPCLFLHTIALSKIGDVPVGKLAAIVIGMTVVTTTVLIIAARIARMDWGTLTSVVQGGIRVNTYIGVSSVVGLFGPPGLRLVAVVTALIVPTVNVICVLSYIVFGDNRFSLPAAIRAVLFNPLLFACLLGAVLNVTGIGLPAALWASVDALGKASLPMGLLCVGAALDIKSAQGATRPLLLASFGKFLMMPGLGVLGCWWLGVGGQSAAVLVLFQALPTASSSYVLARQMGGNATLMALIITVQTVAGLLTLPATLMLLPLLSG